MKKYFILIFFFTYNIYSQIPDTINELYTNVEVTWPSPTPCIKDRFSDFLEQLPKNAIVAEIGVQGGGFSACALNRTNPKKLYLIDCWEYQDPHVYNDPDNVKQEEQEKLYHETQTRFAHDPRVIIMRNYSHDAVSMFENEFFDWIYIDANHGYDAIKEDLASWWPKVKKGGYLCGHDYKIRPDFGIVRAVNEFLRDHKLYFTLLTEGDVYESWAIQKPD